jgi:hypothetical protein
MHSPSPVWRGRPDRRHHQASGTRAGCPRWGRIPFPSAAPPPGRTRSLVTLSFVLLPPSSWPALCRPSRCGEAPCFTDRDHRHEAGDDEGGKDTVRWYVLTLFLTRCITWAGPCASRPDEGRAREASQRWGGERSCRRPRTPVGGRPLAAVCWSKSQRLKVPRARCRPALPLPKAIESRAAPRTTLDHLTAQGSQALGLPVLAPFERIAGSIFARSMIRSTSTPRTSIHERAA